MLLRTVHIENYRSLEHVDLASLGKFNVLIGRNNAGKSSIFNALALLNNSLHGKDIDWQRSRTAHEMARELKICLQFEVAQNKRNEFIEIVGISYSEDRKAALRNSPFLRIYRVHT
jgi:AAA15 family ATPase/GTPase